MANPTILPRKPRSTFTPSDTPRGLHSRLVTELYGETVGLRIPHTPRLPLVSAEHRHHLRHHANLPFLISRQEIGEPGSRGSTASETLKRLLHFRGDVLAKHPDNRYDWSIRMPTPRHNGR